METQSPESRALLWTGSILVAIVVLAVIGYYAGLFSV